MLITINCLECDTAVDADSTRFGTKTLCPKCGDEVDIPKAYMGPGVTLAGFEIRDRIGKGGMGEVFLATQINMRRDVAVKVLPKRMTQNKEAVQRFLHEARVAAKLEHPNVVTIIDAGEDEGYYYIAMRFVKGRTLEQLLKEHRPLPEKDAMTYIRKVLTALDFGWRHHKILHRDVKPANVMIDERGEVKLLDMGLAKGLLEESHITYTGTILGTPYFMSPEQARSEEKLDFHSDMYSAGATLFYLLTGRPPFNKQSSVEVMTQHINEPAPDVREFNPSVSHATAMIVDRMLEKDPADRFSSYEELSEAIDEIIDDDLGIDRVAASLEAPARRVAADFTPQRATGSALRPKALVAGLGMACMACMAAILVVILFPRDNAVPTGPKSGDSSTGVAPANPIREPAMEDPENERVRRKLLAVRNMPTETPSQILAARTRCRHFLTDYQGTRHEEAFNAVWVSLSGSYAALCDKEWQTISKHARQQFNAKREEAAIAILETYTGPLAEGTEGPRQALANQFRKAILQRKNQDLARIAATERAAQLKRERRLKRFHTSLASTRIKVAEALIGQDFATAMAEFGRLSEENDFADFKAEVSDTFSGLSDLCEINGVAMEAVQRLIGQSVAMTINGTSLKAEITGVQDNLILANEPKPYGTVPHKIPLQDLAPAERFKLLAAAKPDVREVMRGLLLWEMNEKSKARAVLSGSSLPIAEVILMTVGLELQSSWLRVLETAQLPLDELDLGKLHRQFDNRRYDSKEKTAIKAVALHFVKFFEARKDAATHVKLARHMAAAHQEFLLPKGFRPVHAIPVNGKLYASGAKAAIEIQRKFAVENSLTVEAVSPTGMSFRLVPTGAKWNFLSNPPNHPFYVSKHEVTAETWQKVMGNYPFPVRKGLPAESITIAGAVEFLEKLCQLEGIPKGSYRLPTSHEWIYACTAGTKSKYYFGDKAGDLGRFANYLDRSAPDRYGDLALNGMKDHTTSDGYPKTAPVGSYPGNPWGVYDMLGNVAEYVADGDLKYAIERGAVKGGSWLQDTRACDVKVERQLKKAMDAFATTKNPVPVGFRIVRTIPKK